MLVPPNIHDSGALYHKVPQNASTVFSFSFRKFPAQKSKYILSLFANPILFKHSAILHPENP